MSKRKLLVSSILPKPKKKLKIFEASSSINNGQDLNSAISQLCEYFYPLESKQSPSKRRLRSDDSASKNNCICSDLPPIILKHQIYSVCKSDRTEIDRKISELRNSGTIRLLRLGGEAHGLQAVVRASDYCIMLRQYAADNCSYVPKDLVERFIKFSLSECSDLSFSSSNSPFTDEQISLLVQLGALTVRGPGSWWFAVPVAGIYVHAQLKARRTILASLRRAKYRELPKQELLLRQYRPRLRLPVEYVLFDLLGVNLVEEVATSGSDIIRLKI